MVDGSSLAFGSKAEYTSGHSLNMPGPRDFRKKTGKDINNLPTFALETKSKLASVPKSRGLMCDI